jgi:hypothetical protein
VQNDGLHGWRSRTTARSAAGSPEMQSRGQTWQTLLKAPRRAPTPTSPTCRTTGEHPPSRNPHHRARSQHTQNPTHTPLLHLPNMACDVARFKMNYSWGGSLCQARHMQVQPCTPSQHPLREPAVARSPSLPSRPAHTSPHFPVVSW